MSQIQDDQRFAAYAPAVRPGLARTLASAASARFTPEIGAVRLTLDELPRLGGETLAGAVTFLARALNAPNSECIAAARGEILEALRSSLSQSSSLVRAAALEGLERHPSLLATAAARAVLLNRGDEFPLLRLAAARYLRRNRSEGDDAALIEGSKSPYWDTAQCCLEVLAPERSTAARSAVLAAMDSPHFQVRVAAARRLKSVADSEDVAARLIAALDDRAFEVAAEAASALGASRLPGARTALEACAKRDNQHPYLRRALHFALRDHLPLADGLQLRRICSEALSKIWDEKLLERLAAPSEIRLSLMTPDKFTRMAAALESSAKALNRPLLEKVRAHLDGAVEQLGQLILFEWRGKTGLLNLQIADRRVKKVEGSHLFDESGWHLGEYFGLASGAPGRFPNAGIIVLDEPYRPRLSAAAKSVQQVPDLANTSPGSINKAAIERIISAALPGRFRDLSEISGHGTQNLVFSADSQEHGPIIVRLGINGDKRLEYVREAWAMRKARAAKLPVPEVLASGSFGDSAFIIQSRLEGRTAAHAAYDQISVHYQLGVLTRRLHQIEAPEKQHLWDPRPAVESRLRRLQSSDQSWLKEVISADELEKLALRIRELPPEQGSARLTHNDLAVRNVLVTPGGEICGLIDWGTARASRFTSFDADAKLRFWGPARQAFYEGYGANPLAADGELRSMRYFNLARLICDYGETRSADAEAATRLKAEIASLMRTAF